MLKIRLIDGQLVSSSAQHALQHLSSPFPGFCFSSRILAPPIAAPQCTLVQMMSITGSASRSREADFAGLDYGMRHRSLVVLLIPPSPLIRISVNVNCKGQPLTVTTGLYHKSQAKVYQGADSSVKLKPESQLPCRVLDPNALRRQCR
ncbi:hypothetical protein Landi51_02792 [Colletotrichum acutatum]